MSDKDKDRVINFEDYKDMEIPDDEDTKKKQEKERLRRERKKQNESVLRLYKLGKYKDK